MRIRHRGTGHGAWLWGDCRAARPLRSSSTAQRVFNRASQPFHDTSAVVSRELHVPESRLSKICCLAASPLSSVATKELSRQRVRASARSVSHWRHGSDIAPGVLPPR